MTLQRTAAEVQMFIDPPPMTEIPAVRETREWAAAMFQRLLELAMQPRVNSIMLARVEVGDQPLARPADGMLIWAAANAAGAGAADGLYFRKAGAWVRVD